MTSRTPPFSLLGSHSETVAQLQALCYSEAFLYPNHCYASVTFPLPKIYLGTLSPARQCWEVIEYGGLCPHGYRELRGLGGGSSSLLWPSAVWDTTFLPSRDWSIQAAVLEAETRHMNLVMLDLRPLKLWNYGKIISIFHTWPTPRCCMSSTNGLVGTSLTLIITALALTSTTLALVRIVLALFLPIPNSVSFSSCLGCRLCGVWHLAR